MQQQERYFIRWHGRISGPFTKEELSERDIEDGTQVWDEEAFNWRDARTFAELREVLDRPPPERPRCTLLNWFRRRVP